MSPKLPLGTINEPSGWMVAKKWFLRLELSGPTDLTNDPAGITKNIFGPENDLSSIYHMILKVSRSMKVGTPPA